MATFALINNGIIENIVAAESADIIYVLVPETEQIIEVTDQTGTASIGNEYDSEVGKFYPFKFFNSWVFDRDNWCWIAPIEYPSDGKMYSWSEDEMNWIEVIIPEQSITEAIAE